VAKMIRKALILEYFTVGYNILEGIVSILIGLRAQSIALVGFGLDSFVESLSGTIMIWRLKKCGELCKEEEEKIEKRAVKLIGFTLFILAGYVLFESLKKIYFQEAPEPTIWGVIIAVISIAIMIPLFLWKNKIGKAESLKSLVTDAKQTIACVFLSCSLLFGLGLNYFFEIWWADPLAALIIAGFLVKEGYSAFKNKELC
jgi:divalent metal cation (Fe/Co/Zn/Cd) transporter